jgi:hypothetical protein
MRDEVARFKYCFPARRVAGKQMKVSKWNRARAFRALHMDGRFQRGHRDAHV